MTSLRALAVALFLIVVTARTARAESAAVRCSATQAGRRTTARVELSHFFDRELLRLVKLGLEGRLHVDVALVRRRVAWFDDVVVTVGQNLVVRWNDELRRYTVNDVPVDLPQLDALDLAHVALGRGHGVSDGSHYLDVTARLQVVTLTSLSGVSSWVTGGGPSSKDLLSRRVARAVVEDLVRKAKTSCDVLVGR